MRNIYVSFRAKRTHLFPEGGGDEVQKGCKLSQANKQTIRQSISMLDLNRNYCQLEFCERSVYLLQMFMLIFAGAPFRFPEDVSIN